MRIRVWFSIAVLSVMALIVSCGGGGDGGGGDSGGGGGSGAPTISVYRYPKTVYRGGTGYVEIKYTDSDGDIRILHYIQTTTKYSYRGSVDAASYGFVGKSGTAALNLIFNPKAPTGPATYELWLTDSRNNMSNVEKINFTIK